MLNSPVLVMGSPTSHKGTPPLKKNVFFRALPKLPLPSPSFGQLVHLFRPSNINVYIVFFNSGRGLPPPSFGQCPKENIFLRRCSLIDTAAISLLMPWVISLIMCAKIVLVKLKFNAICELGKQLVWCHIITKGPSIQWWIACSNQKDFTKNTTFLELFFMFRTKPLQLFVPVLPRNSCSPRWCCKGRHQPCPAPSLHLPYNLVDAIRTDKKQTKL